MIEIIISWNVLIYHRVTFIANVWSNHDLELDFRNWKFIFDKYFIIKILAEF